MRLAGVVNGDVHLSTGNKRSRQTDAQPSVRIAPVGRRHRVAIECDGADRQIAIQIQQHRVDGRLRGKRQHGVPVDVLLRRIDAEMQLGVIEVHARLLGRHHPAGVERLRRQCGLRGLRRLRLRGTVLRQGAAATESKGKAERQPIQRVSHGRDFLAKQSRSMRHPTAVGKRRKSCARPLIMRACAMWPAAFGARIASRHGAAMDRGQGRQDKKRRRRRRL